MSFTLQEIPSLHSVNTAARNDGSIKPHPFIHQTGFQNSFIRTPPDSSRRELIFLSVYKFCNNSK